MEVWESFLYDLALKTCLLYGEIHFMMFQINAEYVMQC